MTPTQQHPQPQSDPYFTTVLWLNCVNLTLILESEHRNHNTNIEKKQKILSSSRAYLALNWLKNHNLQPPIHPPTQTSINKSI